MRSSTVALLALLASPFSVSERGMAQSQSPSKSSLDGKTKRKPPRASKSKADSKSRSKPKAKSQSDARTRNDTSAKPEHASEPPEEARDSALPPDPLAPPAAPSAAPAAAGTTGDLSMAPPAEPTLPTAEAASVAPPATETPLHLALFVDAYAAWQSSGKGTLATLSGHRAFSGQGATFRAENGFALAFLGLDASYETPRFGATANLRFGQGAAIYHAPTDSESAASFGIDLLTQAYATWRPADPLAIDLGMFSTPFGAEVLESWKNLNYTRGALYFYAQPAWHTGLRLAWQLSDAWSLTGFVADGTNLISETQQNSGLDQAPTLGLQVGFAPTEGLSLLAGGLFALDSFHNDDAGFDALGDVVATLELGGLRAAFNADVILTRDDAPSGADRHFLGFSLAAGYAFSEAFGVAARGEYLLDDANFDGGDQDKWRLLTVTLTTDFKPLPHTPNLILRWDNRWEESNQDIFGADARGTADPADDTYEDVWFESVIGVVVTTSP